MDFNKQPNQDTGIADRGRGSNSGINIVQPHKPESNNGDSEPPKKQKPTGGNGKKIAVFAGAAALIAVVIALAYSGFSEGGSDIDPAVTCTDSLEYVSEVMPADNIAETPADKTPEAETPVAETPEDVVQAADEAPATDNVSDAAEPAETSSRPAAGSYQTPLGIYKGKTDGGVPNGLGTVMVTVSTEVTDFNSGGRITIRPGDEIRRAKFVDGRFVQGELWRNGEKIALIGSGAI